MRHDPKGARHRVQASQKRPENEDAAEEDAARRDIRGGARGAGASQKRAMNGPWLADEDSEG